MSETMRHPIIQNYSGSGGNDVIEAYDLPALRSPGQVSLSCPWGLWRRAAWRGPILQLFIEFDGHHPFAPSEDPLFSIYPKRKAF
jgi:hypothetical protein